MSDDPESGSDADPESVARAICLRQLTMGPRTRSQLAQALGKRNVPADAAASVVKLIDAAQESIDRLANVAAGIGTNLDISV